MCALNQIINVNPFSDKTITIDCHTTNICKANKVGDQASHETKRMKNKKENLQMKNEQEQISKDIM